MQRSRTGQANAPTRECQIYINGREWLARQLDRHHVGYVRYDNSLLAIDNLDVASELCERFAHKAWPRVLNGFARPLNPLLPTINAAGYGGYYCVLDQAEIATDVMVTTRPQLLRVWPDLVRHAALNMSSEDVLGFPGSQTAPVAPSPGGDRRQTPTPRLAKVGDNGRL